MNEKPRVCTIESPCKINLHLKIGEKRPDGYHNLESLFVSLAFGDTLRFERVEQDGCQLSVNWELPQEIPEGFLGENNLILRAVTLFRERTGFKSGLRIRLDKRIPLGAGLGGGSSNAASSLLALNSLADGALPPDELSKMAAFLGSDAPFFLSGGAAFVGGRGELVEPVKFPGNLWVVLVKPSFSSATADAYRLLDRARERETCEKRGEAPPENALSGKVLSPTGLSIKGLIRALKEAPSGWPFQNDFLPVLLGSNSPAEGEQGVNTRIYEAILEALRREGASFTALSGSGSCCFGIFDSKAAAERAAKQLACQTAFRGSKGFPSGQVNFIKFTFFLARRADPVLE